MPYTSHLGVIALLTALSTVAAAQSTQPTRLRGTVESVTPTGIVVKTRTGAEAAIQLPENLRVAAVSRATLSDIRKGSYVGAAALPQADGTQKALEVTIFPEAMRGAGEGFRPWDLLPESTMTNATVAETVAETNGATLTLAYKEGRKTLVVPPDSPVVLLAPATRAEIRPGAKVVVTVTRSADGTEIAANVVVGRDGVDPPM